MNSGAIFFGSAQWVLTWKQATSYCDTAAPFATNRALSSTGLRLPDGPATKPKGF